MLPTTILRDSHLLLETSSFPCASKAQGQRLSWSWTYGLQRDMYLNTIKTFIFSFLVSWCKGVIQGISLEPPIWQLLQYFPSLVFKQDSPETPGSQGSRPGLTPTNPRLTTARFETLKKSVDFGLILDEEVLKCIQMARAVIPNLKKKLQYVFLW